MRRIISFVLVLAFCLSLACPAFAASYKKSPAEDGPSHRPDRWWGDNPKTGDVIMFWAVIMVVSVAALGMMYMFYRKKFC